MAKSTRIPKKLCKKKTCGRKKQNRMHCGRETGATGKRVKKLCQAVCRKLFDMNLRKLYTITHEGNYLRKILKENVKIIERKRIRKLENLQSTNSRDWWNIIVAFNGLHYYGKGHISEQKYPK